MRSVSSLFISVFFSIFLVSSAFGAVICAVPDPFDNDCSDGVCWLQSALDATESNGEDDVIKIVQGTYQGGFAYQSWEGYNIRLEGGYNANCQSQVLDPQNTILDGQNQLGVLRISQQEGGDIYVEGLTIQNSVYYNMCGLNPFTKVTAPGQSANITIYKNICKDNDQGLCANANDYTNDALQAGTIIIEENIIKDNTSGGVAAHTSSKAGIAGEVKILNNIITGNHLGVNTQNKFVSSTTSGTAKKVTVMGNFVSGNENFPGLSVSIEPGTGIGEEIWLENNIIAGNSEGGLYIDAPASGTAGVSGATVFLLNNIVANNTKTGHGGGIYFASTNPTINGDEGARFLINNTITKNQTSEWSNGHGIDINTRDDSVYHLSNNIIWDNDDGDPDPYDIRLSGSGTTNIYWNDYTTIREKGNVNKGNNLDVNPDFVSPAANDYHLKSTSPCIDVGYNSVPNIPARDIDDEPRIFDGDGNDVAIVDMGADEYVDIISDIKINGSDGPLTLNNGDPLNITVSLDPGSQAGDPADYWVVVQIPSGIFCSYHADAWDCGSIQPAYQGPLMSLTNYPVFSCTVTAGLLRGAYTFYFAVDLNQNGIIDLAEILKDQIVVEIQ